MVEPLKAIKGFHEADLEQPCKHKYLRLRKYFWCRKFQIYDLLLLESSEVPNKNAFFASSFRGAHSRLI